MTEILEIWGGHPLCGMVKIPSAKNSVLPLLAASVLCREKVCLEKVPDLSDVQVSLALLRELGVSARQSGERVLITPGRELKSSLSTEMMHKMRASVLFLAPVLSRTGSVDASLPGGCKLGARPIDIHLDGLEKMGASIHWHEERLYLRAPHGLKGTEYTLRCPSVGATETLLLAAVCARGTTILHGTAREPEITDLANFLNVCGGRITGAGTETIRIEGVSTLFGTTYTPVADRIVAATVACACAAAGGCVTMQDVRAELFAPVLDVLEKAGCNIQREGESVTIERRNPLHGVGLVETGVYPGFPTDAAPLLAAALLQADGESCIRDTIFPKRFACAEGFGAMGARVRLQDAALYINSGAITHGAMTCAQDLRGGAALAIAALAATGKTEIKDAFYIKRGYADLKSLFRQLGVKTRMFKK